MANIPLKKKGAPPPLTDTVDNLGRSDPNDLVALNFKVDSEFKREFKTYASNRGVSMLKLLKAGFALYKERNGA